MWLYSSYFISYFARPMGMWYFHVMICRFGMSQAIFYSMYGWIISTFILFILPFFHLPLGIFCFLLISARSLGQFCIGGENIMARTILIAIPQDGMRMHKNIYYERAIIFGYLLSILSLHFLSWNIIMIQILILSALCIYLRHHIPKLTRLYDKPLTLKFSKNILSPYILSGISLSYLANTMGMTYVHQVSNYLEQISSHNSITCGLLLWNILLLTGCKNIRTMRNYTNILYFSAIMLTLSSLIILYYLQTLPIYLLTLLRVWTISWGVIFDIYFYSSIKKHSDYTIHYIIYGIQQWLASMLYGKGLAWLLINCYALPRLYSQSAFFWYLTAPLCIFFSSTILYTKKTSKNKIISRMPS